MILYIIPSSYLNCSILDLSFFFSIWPAWVPSQPKGVALRNSTRLGRTPWKAVLPQLRQQPGCAHVRQLCSVPPPGQVPARVLPSAPL